MARVERKGRPWIGRRYASTVLLAAMLPAVAVAFVALLLLSAGPGLEQRVARPVRNEAAKQFDSTLQAEAGRLDERLGRVSSVVKALAAYTAAVLKAPAAYTPHAPAEPAKPGVPPPKAVENPVYYPRGTDGALRKPVDDGLSAVFYRARDEQRNFTEFEHQQLYATATLDPLLQNMAESDKLCDTAYIATKDGLIRLFPWFNLQGWPGSRNPMADLTMCSYSKDKANSEGVVWTKPYESKLSGKWCIACVAPVTTGGKVVGIAGCEISLDKLPEGLLRETPDTGNYQWLARPEGIVLAAQDTAIAKLGVTPVSEAALVSAGNIQDKAYTAATVSGTTPTAVAQAWLALGQEGGVKQIQTESAVVLVGKGLLPVTGLTLGAARELPALTAIESYIGGMRQAQVPALLTLLGVTLLGMLLAVLAARLEARRITHPLKILTGQARSVVSTGVTTAVVIADPGELGELSTVMQALIDTACARGAESHGPAAPASLPSAMASAEPPEPGAVALEAARQTGLPFQDAGAESIPDASGTADSSTTGETGPGSGDNSSSAE